ncbi:hypothetical protein FFLO_00388 [Filobasidium floriforme]|uniref:CTLH domain-containing protein n=1 Tax=Filobasidium floriforme TaxID=5210 RepID=A0A8K0JSK1_9TREE|nr:negative regulation of gluconeogenesis-related protein [Filobasidium floriforme]KAG7575398.1 hypothetical protein FFLO_00388 [Filobasidium floriforme]KAH8089510.1 negative regulation of gluconeogenesis-related protein [Filobasidium floriforme]
MAGSTSTAGSGSQDQSKSNGDVDGSGNGEVKGKGKQRAEPEFGRSGSGVDGVGVAIEGSKGAHTPAKREEVVRLMLQALRDIGYSQSAEVLEAESGYVQEPALAGSFRQAILGGRWSEAIHLLSDLGVVLPEDRGSGRKNTNSADLTFRNGSGSNSKKQDTPGRRAIFMVLRQKYLELIEAGQTVRALKVLRLEVAPAATDTAKLHALSGLMMCMKKADLYAKAKWDGATGSSRQELLDDLQEFLPTGVIMPPKRLATLFDQARKYQEGNCVYHSGYPAETLLSDHRCKREVFPTVATHVLAEHTDEVWTIQWSRDGRYLASAGKDMSIIIWKVEPTPTRTCEKHMTLRGHSEAVSALAWSPDGSRLVSAAESTVILWDMTMGVQLAYLPETHHDTVSQVQWISNEAGFVTAAMDQKIVTWTRDGKLKSTLPTGPLRIFDFVVSKDLDRIIAITNVVGGQTHGNLRPTASRLPVAGAIPGRTGSVLNENSSVPNYSIGKMERDIVIYDLANGNVIAWVPGEMGSISLSDDGNQALVTAAPNDLQLWNVEDNFGLVRRYTEHQHLEYQIKSCFGGRDRSFVISASEDSRIYVWQKDTGKLLEKLDGHKGVINAVAWNPVYPDLFASCADDDTIRLWQPASVALSVATARWAGASSDAPQLSPIGDIPSGIDMDLVF